jgi:hypoxanthine phosphoribosyltransferase
LGGDGGLINDLKIKFNMKDKRFKAFVIMPSGGHGEYPDGPKEADYIYKKIIKPAINEALNENVDIIQEMNNMAPGAINKSIVKNVALSDIAVVDITGQNPNVYLELGMRFVFKPSTTIILMQEGTYIPFDIKNYRCIKYSIKFDGPQKAKTDIKNLVSKSIYENANLAIDSLVYDVYPNLQVSCSEPEIVDRKNMPWKIYWSQIETIIELLKNSSYQPDYLIGVSNGGLFVADSIHRLVYFKVQLPLISLWANRLAKRNDYFNNSTNDSVIQSIVNPNPKILLIDDLISTGTTFYKAKEFILKKIPKSEIHLLPLFSRNIKYLEKIEPETVWNLSPKLKESLSNSFNFTDFCYTEFLNLPYDKKINQSK